MNSKKTKQPQKAASKKTTTTSTNKKENPATKIEVEDAPVSSGEEENNLTESKKGRGRSKGRNTTKSKTENTLAASQNIPSGPESNEFQEFMDFLEISKNYHPQFTLKQNKVQTQADKFEILKRESKKLTQLIFQQFDKVQLNAEIVQKKVGITTEPVQIQEEEELQKPQITMEEEPVQDPADPPAVQESQERQQQQPQEIQEEVNKEEIKEEKIQEIPAEKKEMEIEDKKPEEPAAVQPIPRKNIKELLKVDLYLDDNGANDDRLASINFEPTLEIMRTSTHIDVDEVCNIIESTKKKDGPKDADVSTSKFLAEGLSENYQKINELVSGISDTDLQRLEPEVYLNDTLINFYLKLIELCLINNERKNKVHIFNTYFMAKMRKLFGDMGSDYTKFDTVYEKMERWTRRLDLLAKDFILIPVNENEHWNMILICYPHRFFSEKEDELPLVVYLDSICRMEDTYAKMLYHFFAAEAKAKKKDEAIISKKLGKLSSTEFPYYQPMVPKQSNWTDCGLYLLQYTELFSEDESYILNNTEEIDKTRWFPRGIITDKRGDIKTLIRDLKAYKYDAIKDYLDRRDKRLKDYAKFKDSYDPFDQKAFDKALKNKYRYNFEALTPQDIALSKLDFYYFGSLDLDQHDDQHI